MIISNVFYFNQIISKKSKFCCQKSFLITHLDETATHLKARKLGQTSVISQTVVLLLNNFFFHPSIPRLRFSPTKKNETFVFWGKADSDIVCYLDLQVAATVCQILNLSWLDFSQATTFHKTSQELRNCPS